MAHPLINRGFYDAIVRFEISDEAKDTYYRIMDTCVVRNGKQHSVREQVLRAYAMLFCDDIGAEADRCGFAGSPTNVNKIVAVVLAGGDYKEVAATDEGVKALVDELVADHTIG